MARYEILHNPRCGKSRQTLDLLRSKGVEPKIREYLKEPPNKAEVEKLIGLVGGDLTAASYAGIYALTDRIEIGSDRVDIKNLSPSDNSATEITGGYILKFDVPSSDEYSWVTRNGFPNNGTSAIVVASQKATDLTTAQRDYIRNYVQQMEDAYSVFRCRSIMNCVNVCPKKLNPTKAIGKIKQLMLKEEN